uniref:Uncharacterized protein n=1 Tax=viral metagenome TaxID=1070528 RepID=A0A6M3KDC0_9ZZZZ
MEYTNERCNVCGGFAGFETSPEGEKCDVCERWICADCVNWSMTSESQTLCVECSPKGSNMEYTKGDWRVAGLYNIEGEMVFEIAGNDDDGCIVARVPTKIYDEREEMEEAEDNAHLIAAAPAMYEALKGLASAYNIDVESVIVNQDPHYWKVALQAIAKAEGVDRVWYNKE